jgi:hypothetical protein
MPLAPTLYDKPFHFLQEEMNMNDDNDEGSMRLPSILIESSIRNFALAER